MKKDKRKLFEQNEDETGVDAAVSRGQDQIPLEKIEAFKNTVAKMYDATTKLSSAGSSPSQATGATQEPNKAGQPSNTAGSNETQKKGSIPKSQDLGAGAEVQQSVSQAGATDGFVELEKDATDQALTFLSDRLKVDKDSIKKLSMTRGVRILLDPKYLKVQ